MIKIMKYGEVPASELFTRVSFAGAVEETVAEILANVKANGDAALYEYSRKFDKAELSSLELSAEEWEAGAALAEPDFVRVLNEAAENIRNFHRHQLRSGFIVNEANGIVMGQKVIPIERAGLYVPGGTASYPSMVLMDAIPAKLAGVSELVMVTPPARDGSISPNILAAAKIAGVDRIFKVGGAQAIAALAYGTQSIPKVDKIVGPGNAFVAEAKKQVYGLVSIDMIAGPSEVMIVSDGKSDPRFVAADMLAQAEHDKLATAVLVTDSEELAKAVAAEIEAQLRLLAREEIARASIENNGKIIVAQDLHNAIDIANEIAPEHLEICTDSPFDWLGEVKNAGSVFLGRYTPEALGDYLAGPNHTLPTLGTARFSNPLSVDDFVKKTQYSYYSREALEKVADEIAVFAKKEGLTAHARSAVIRFGGEDKI